MGGGYEHSTLNTCMQFSKRKRHTPEIATFIMVTVFQSAKSARLRGPTPHFILVCTLYVFLSIYQLF